MVVPVLKQSDELSFADIERNIFLLSEKARLGNITINDLQGGTFTISNGGENDYYGGAIKIVGQSSWDNSTNQNVTNYYFGL